MTEEKPDPAPDENHHQDDGLDLARSIAPATARATPPPRRRRKRRGRPVDTKVPGPPPAARPPQLLGDQVGRLVADRGWELELRVRGVFARWPDLVGADVGAHCTPEAFTEGRLVVRT